MISKNNNVSEFIILNLYLVIFYFLIYLNLNTSATSNIMFSSPDSLDYLSIGNWIFENVETNQTLYNPILYPFFLKLSLLLFGVKGVWLLQFLFWLFSVNFLFYAIKQIINKRFALIGAGLFSLNLSYLALTLHALTDVTVTLIICMLIFYLSKKIKDFKKPQFFCTVLLFFSLLSIIKPVYFPVFIILLFVVFPVFYFRRYTKNTKKYLLLVALVPVLIQLSLMIYRHNTFQMSAKGIITFKSYFYAQGFAEVNNMSLEEADKAVNNQSAESMMYFISDHKKVYAANFIKNIVSENITGGPTFLAFPPEYKHVLFYNIMKLENGFFMLLHVLFAIPCLFFMHFLLKRKSSLLGFYIFLLLLFYYSVLITGITFWQGDRYTISFQPIWIILYLLITYKLYPYMRLLLKDKSSLKA